MRRHRTLTPSLFILCLLFGPALAHADFQAGKDAYDRKDYSTALNEWLPLAEQGDTLAQQNLGLLYQHGKVVPIWRSVRSSLGFVLVASSETRGRPPAALRFAQNRRVWNDRRSGGWGFGHRDAGNA